MPDTRAASIGKFARELHRVRTAAGSPSDQAVESASGGPGAVRVARSVISDVLAGEQVPAWEFVVGFVTACEAYAAEQGVILPADVPDLGRLRRLYDSMLDELDREQGATVRTAAVPGPASRFRESEVIRLSQLAVEARSVPEAVPVIVVSGPPGVGKTSIVSRFAEAAQHDFRDGAYRVSLAYPPGAGSALDESLSAIIRRHGVRDEVPDSFGARCSLLREILATNEILFIIDDAEEPTIVSALLPEAASRSLIIVISEKDLSGLAGRRFELRSASLPDSVAFIREIIGADKSAADPEAVTAIAEQAGGLALTLRMAAEGINRAPGGAREAAAQVRQASARAGTKDWLPDSDVIAWAYWSLSSYAATVLRALACAYTIPIPRQLVAFLIGKEAESTELRSAIAELADRHLISAEGGSIRINALIAGFGQGRARAEESAEWIDGIADRAQRISLLASGHQLQPEPLIASDQPTLEDQLSHAYYGDAIADFIRHPQTLPPLTIGLKAPWGAGKTSLMRMIQNNLDPRHQGKPSRLQLDVQALGKDTRLGLLLTRRRQSGRDEGITNLDILRQANAAEEVPAAGRPGAPTGPGQGPLRAGLADCPPLDASGWRPTVWFNPWMYQSGEQTWAGLAHVIISQVTERLRPADRELFWLLLNLSRVDPSAVRRRWYRIVVERLVPLALAWSATIAVTLILLLIAALIPSLRDALRYLAGGLSAAGTVALLVGGLVNVGAFLNRRAAGPLSALVRKPDISSTGKAFLEGQFKDSLDQLVPDPGYAARLGFLHLVQEDMHRVLKLIATPKQPLVIFVDDLDRCSPGTVSQVIEAINLFLAGEFPNCVFVLGMEPGAVASHIETAHPDLAKAQRDGRPDEDWSSLGWRFLDKIIQLPLSVPALRTDDDVARYLRSLMRPGQPGPPAIAGAQNRPAEVAVPGPDSIATPGPGALPGPAEADDNPDAAPDFARADAIEKAIRARHPSPGTIRDVALEAQLEVLGRPTPILPVTMAAASRILAILYSDTDAYDTLRAALSLLPSRNPREIKRFVNLFRFYSFIAGRGRLIGYSAASKEQIAKVAAFAIRWPSIVSRLASVPEAGGHVLLALENAARAEDIALWEKALRENLPGLPLPDTPAAPSGEPGPSPAAAAGQDRELRQFLRKGAEIGHIAAQFF